MLAVNCNDIKTLENTASCFKQSVVLTALATQKMQMLWISYLETGFLFRNIVTWRPSQILLVL